MELRACEEVGVCSGGVSVESNGPGTGALDAIVSFSWWPSCRKRSASSASLEMSLGGVGGLAGRDEKTEDEEPGDDMVTRTKTPRKTKIKALLACCEVRGGCSSLLCKVEESYLLGFALCASTRSAWLAVQLASLILVIGLMILISLETENKKACQVLVTFSRTNTHTQQFFPLLLQYFQ